MQLKQFPEATATLTPLVDKQPRLADQVLFWLGKAQAGAALAADPANAAARDTGLRLRSRRSARGRQANQLAATDPDAKPRRGEILLELADTHQLAKLFKEAVPIYEQLLNEKILPARTEEMTQRLISALHLAGEYARSDQICANFQKDFPRSPLLSIVLFRSAENAYFNCAGCREDGPTCRTRPWSCPSSSTRLRKRYKAVIEGYPEFERIELARYGLAMCHFKKNDSRPRNPRIDPRARPGRRPRPCPYLLAECLIRLAPSKADDAFAVGMLQEKLQAAQQNLEGFIGATRKRPRRRTRCSSSASARRTGAHARQRAGAGEHALTAARMTFDKLIQTYPKEPQGMQAVMERTQVPGGPGR